MLRWQHWSSVQTGNYYLAKQTTGHPPGSGTWSAMKKFVNFQAMKSVVLAMKLVALWGFGIIKGFRRAVHIWLAPQCERKNLCMERLLVCGRSNKRKSSRYYHFRMHTVVPILRVVRIWRGWRSRRRSSVVGSKTSRNT